jgi:hypothetical protein
MQQITVRVKGHYVLEEISFKEIRLAVEDYYRVNGVPGHIFLSRGDHYKLTHMCQGLVVAVPIAGTHNVLRLNLHIDRDKIDNQIFIT